MAAFELRPAREEDYELMWRIQRRSLGPYVTATWGWDEAVQRDFYDRNFDHRTHHIVRVAGSDAGFLSFQLRADHLYLADLALLPEYQRQGVGTEVLHHVIARAGARGVPVRLQVLESNPARAFYERHGFVQRGETETHVRMERPVESAWNDRESGGSAPVAE